MKSSLKFWLLLVLAVSAGVRGASAEEESVFLFQNRKVVFVVPKGLGFASTKDEHGIISVRVGHPKNKISFQVSFLPDPDGRFGTPRGRKEFMAETFQEYVAGSVEKAMRFEELEPRVGAGTYCVFTDSNLVGQDKVPRGEFRHSTTGLKTWPGVMGVFTLMSNDTTSEEYRAIMAMLRESMEEKTGPLR